VGEQEKTGGDGNRYPAGFPILFLSRVYPTRVSLATRKTRPFRSPSFSLWPIRRSCSPCWASVTSTECWPRQYSYECAHQRLDSFLTNRDPL